MYFRFSRTPGGCIVLHSQKPPGLQPQTVSRRMPSAFPPAPQADLAKTSALKIGALSVPNPVLLAPMAGVTDLPMRELCMELGAGLAVAEMLAADPRLAQSRKSTLRRQHSGRAGPRSVQIVGSEPQQLADAARRNVDDGADIIDINMGCPAKKVCKKAAGSALLADEALVGHILDAVVTAVDVPVTLKIRTGVTPERRNAVAIAKLAEQAGIQMLAVHGRTRADRFKGEAEYHTIAAIVDAVRIPVLANGDITSAIKARAVLEQTGAAGVMIGRGAQGRPWLPGLIAKTLAHGSARTPSPAERFGQMQRHLSALHDFYGEFAGCRIARKHLGWFTDALFCDLDPSTGDGSSRMAVAAQWRSRFNSAKDCAAQHHLLDGLQSTLNPSGTLGDQAA